MIFDGIGCALVGGIAWYWMELYGVGWYWMTLNGIGCALPGPRRAASGRQARHPGSSPGSTGAPDHILDNVFVFLLSESNTKTKTTHLTVSRDSDHLESEKAKSVEENNGGGGQAVPMFRTCLSDLQKLALNIEGELFCFLNFERLEQK